jgi:drug/metabolite transporter (DMT)-like permease
MSWLVISLLAYFIFAVVFLIDKYLLAGSVKNPKLYTFYTGFLRISVVFLIPFIDFNFPGIWQIILSFFAGSMFIIALYWFFKGLQLFEPSRIVPAVGGVVPIFTFLLIFLISLGKEIPSTLDLLAFFILICGSLLISYEKTKAFSWEILRLSLVAAFFFTLFFVLAKYVYLTQSFLQGFIWISLGGFLTALLFLFSRELRDNLFKVKLKVPKRVIMIFVSNQAMGALSNFLQSWAVALAPLAYVSVVNALQGVQYVFLLGLATILSVKFPKILREEVSREVIFYKIAAIFLIVLGLLLLAF